ncbi:MAG: hypothetical protein AAF292_04370 [Pseudomonadota bacterium]
MSALGDTQTKAISNSGSDFGPSLPVDIKATNVAERPKSDARAITLLFA